MALDGRLRQLQAVLVHREPELADGAQQRAVGKNIVLIDAESELGQGEQEKQGAGQPHDAPGRSI